MSDVARLLEIMARLRDPNGGCPWDLEQDFASIAPYTIEEAYEVDDAIRRGDITGLRDELGDLLLQVVFHAQMAREAGHFDFGDVVDTVCEKLVSRHPHVFGEAHVPDARAQTDAWERHKAAERAAKGEHSAMDGVPLGLPALMRARKLVSRAARAGLAPDAAPVEGPVTAQQIGEMLLATAALAQRAGIDPEQALRERLAEFEAALRREESAR